MIQECIKGMISFLFIVAMFVLSFSLVNYQNQYVEKGGKKKSIAEYLGAQYQTVFGENLELDPSSKYTIEWILYIFFTVLINIVLLNLLISIISEDYERVQSQKKSTDLMAKLDILQSYGALEHFFKAKIMCVKF